MDSAWEGCLSVPGMRGWGAVAVVSGRVRAGGHRVASGHEDTDGLNVPAGSLALNGGVIARQDTPVSAGLTHAGAAADMARKVDGIAPTVLAIAAESTPGGVHTHVPNSPSASIKWLVLFHEGVVVEGVLAPVAVDRSPSPPRSWAKTAGSPQVHVSDARDRREGLRQARV